MTIGIFSTKGCNCILAFFDTESYSLITLEIEETKEKLNDVPAMKKVELNRIVEFLRKKSSDEKTPFAQAVVHDNGTIPKDPESKNDVPGKEIPSDSDELEGGMSLPRKFCFVMSFNAWILYFLVLGWIVPCKQPECPIPYDTWEKNLSSIWPLTNIEIFNADTLASLALIGYSDEDRVLAALDSDGGNFVWNNTLGFLPRDINCNFRFPFDVNGDGIGDCLLTGLNDVYAFNATDGYVFWELNFPSEEGNIITRFESTSDVDGVSFLLSVRGEKVEILFKNGSKFSEIDAPCSSPLDLQVIPHVINESFTMWNLICDYGDSIETWALPERDLLKKGNPDHATEFSLLFSGTNYDGSMNFGCDVTTVPESSSLLFSWSDRVAMVTASMSIAWERGFPYLLSVTSLVVGRFTSEKENQIAVSLQNDTNSEILLLEMKNGSTLSTLRLADKMPQKLYKIPGKTDSLLLKSISMNYTSQPVYNQTDPIPIEKTNFALIQAVKGTFIVREIATMAKISGSALNIRKDGEVDLMVIKNTEGTTTFLNYIVQRSPSKESFFCGKHSAILAIPEL